MVSHDVLEAILTNTYTESALAYRVATLRSFLEHVLYTDHGTDDPKQHLDQFCAEQDIPAETCTALHEWPSSVYEAFTHNNMYDLFHELEAARETLPRLTLYVPTTLSGEAYARIGEWAREHVASNVLLKVAIDPHATGGCAFVWNGTYHDFSFRRFVREREGEVIRTIREYTRSHEE